MIFMNFLLTCLQGIHVNTDTLHDQVAVYYVYEELYFKLWIEN